MAANVGYFVSLVLALVAASVVGPSRLRRRLGLGLATFNAGLLASAGFAWGWRNVGLGIAVVAAVCLLPRATRMPAGPADPQPAPVRL